VKTTVLPAMAELLFAFGIEDGDFFCQPFDDTAVVALAEIGATLLITVSPIWSNASISAMVSSSPLATFRQASWKASHEP